MACVEKYPSAHVDSEREEGEIVDELDDLSEISSEEEFLLRQRLEVLENYNNVLERKEAKRSSVGSGRKDKRNEALLYDLSEISISDLEDPQLIYRDTKHRHIKYHHKQKRKKEWEHTNFMRKEKKKVHRNKKKLELKVISETSEESDDEYRNKRRRLADAVVVNKDKNDTSSLKARLTKMLCESDNRSQLKVNSAKNKLEVDTTLAFSLDSQVSVNSAKPCNDIQDDAKCCVDTSEITPNTAELIDLCTDDEVKIVENNSQDTIDSVEIENKNDDNKQTPEKDSDEDEELLRQQALKTKVSKEPCLHLGGENEDEDSDTAELRLICLKSALLKKAIEMKQKQKLKKRLSQSSIMYEEVGSQDDELLNNVYLDNNTDRESVDMDIGSDGDEKVKESSNELVKVTYEEKNLNVETDVKKSLPELKAPKEDEFEEDEDLLRAKLLTSLSKNLPNLVNPSTMNITHKVEDTEKSITPAKNIANNIPEEKRFIINLGESDSEGEHEATKNLTKMHMKLSEQSDFQQQLDSLLKSTRMQVEKTKQNNDSNLEVVQPAAIQPLPKQPQKFIPKALNHLPKCEQIEYKRLVKRMAELEKIKQTRQSSINLVNQMPLHVKDTLKPRNITIDSTKMTEINLDEQIALSRKKIAEESAKMLKLKDEAIKLSQKYKIAATELRNITTAITLNKKQQKSAQNKLSKIRAQHQMLLNSSSSKHSKFSNHIQNTNRPNNKVMTTSRLQKENDPLKEEYNNPHMLKSVKVSVVNDFKDETPPKPNPRLSVQVDVTTNKKVVRVPNASVEDRLSDPKKDNLDVIKKSVIKECKDKTFNSYNGKESDTSHPIDEKGGGKRRNSKEMLRNVSSYSIRKNKNVDDYESPLQALTSATWPEDPNAVLCPFEVGGNCKDPDCKYLHPKIPSEQ